MVTGKDRATLMFKPDRHLGASFDLMEKQGRPLEVTINNRDRTGAVARFGCPPARARASLGSQTAS